MYRSPIEIIYGDTQIQMEGDILKAVQSYGIKVDKEELIRVLNNDRNQYDDGHKAGYREGYNDVMNSIVRCKDCKHYRCFHNECRNGITYPDDFCSYGERRQDAISD